MRIGWDQDGVNHIFDLGLSAYLDSIGVKHNFPRCPETNEVLSWDFYDSDFTLEEFLKHSHDAADAGYLFNGFLRPGAKEAMDRVKDMGHEIVIITDRFFGKDNGFSSQQTTKRWLKEHGLPYDQLVFSADKTVVKTDMFIEDKLANYDTLDAAGVEVWLINRPWNKLNDKRRRVDTLAEFADRVLARTYREEVIANGQQVLATV